MTDPDLVAFIRNYDIIFFIETMKGNDFTLAIPGYKFHHVNRKHKHKMPVELLVVLAYLFQINMQI